MKNSRGYICHHEIAVPNNFANTSTDKYETFGFVVPKKYICGPKHFSVQICSDFILTSKFLNLRISANYELVD
jgi:hypothetical protein